jgi:hypothetical protein
MAIPTFYLAAGTPMEVEWFKHRHLHILDLVMILGEGTVKL